jgi:hypothetical protein
MAVETSHILHWRWETEFRFNETHVGTDLFGDQVLLASWGGKQSRLGRSRIMAVGEIAINGALERIEVERSRHGYFEVH